MTLREIWDRIAGNDYEWIDVDMKMIEDNADLTVSMAVLTGMDHEGKPVLFRLPVERLRKKQFTWHCPKCGKPNTDTRRSFVLCAECGTTYDKIPN